MLLKYFKSVCFYIVFLMIWSRPALSFSTIKSLPGFSALLPMKLETVYIGVGETELFYYFIESERNPAEDTLLLWLTGGPGCSTLSGLFFLKYVSSIIFLDAPVGTGFSYSMTLQGSETGDAEHAISCYNFLRKWLQSHPKFIRNPLYVAGDSYSGMIVPIVAQAISDGGYVLTAQPLKTCILFIRWTNDRVVHAASGIKDRHIPAKNLKGYLLGNPMTDSRFDGNSRIPYFHRMALISDELYQSTKRNYKEEYLEVDYSNTKCVKDLHAIAECPARINNFHILESCCHSEFGKFDNNRKYFLETYGDSLQLPAPPEYRNIGCRNYVCYLCKIWASDISVQKALHIREGTVKEWVKCNKSMPYDYDVQSTLSYHLHLITRGYRALIYSGDHDAAVPYIGTESWIRSLNFSVSDDWRPWFVDGQVGGYTKEYGNNLTFATVKGAGHTAPEYNPKECLGMLKRWISHEPL